MCICLHFHSVWNSWFLIIHSISLCVCVSACQRPISVSQLSQQALCINEGKWDTKQGGYQRLWVWAGKSKTAGEVTNYDNIPLKRISCNKSISLDSQHNKNLNLLNSLIPAFFLSKIISQKSLRTAQDPTIASCHTLIGNTRKMLLCNTKVNSLCYCYPKRVMRIILIRIHSMKARTATGRHGVTRKRSTKRLKHKGNLFRKNLPLTAVC